MPSAQWSLWINTIVAHFKHSWVYNFFAWNTNTSIICPYIIWKMTKGTRTENEQRNKIRRKMIYLYIQQCQNRYNIHILLSNLHISARVTIWLVAFKLAILHTNFSWEIYWTQYSNACPLFSEYWSQFPQLTAVNDVSRIFRYQIDLWRADLR